MNKNITKKILIYTDDDLSKHKWLISLDNEFILKTLFKEYDKQPQLSNNTYIKGKTGEFFLENIFIKYDINYVKTCDKPHCGDFIINNKIMIDAKNYKNIINKTQITKLLFDMEENDIKYGIIISFNDNIFKYEIKNNIVIFYISFDEELIYLYLDFFINYFYLIQNNDYILTGDINEIYNKYMDSVVELKKIKQNIQSLIDDTVKNNNSLKRSIDNVVYKKIDIEELENIRCHKNIKKIISTIKYDKIGVNNNRIYFSINNETINVYMTYSININNNIIIHGCNNKIFTYIYLKNIYDNVIKIDNVKNQFIIKYNIFVNDEIHSIINFLEWLF